MIHARASAMVLIGIVRAGAAASSGKVALAISLGMTASAALLGISVGHATAAI